MVAVVIWHLAHAAPTVIAGVVGLQTEIVPSRVANAKLLLVGFKAVPVGLPVPVAPAGGIATAKPAMVPLASYKVESPVTWSLTHHSFSAKVDSPDVTGPTDLSCGNPAR